jgi:hypothetical protein
MAKLVAYITNFPGQGPTARMVYRAGNGHIIELSLAPGSPWRSNDLMITGAPQAVETPFAYVTEFTSEGPTARLVYRGQDGHIYELFLEVLRANTWAYSDLSKQSGAVALGGAAEVPIAYVTNFPGQGPTARVVYRAGNGHIIELSLLSGSPWGSNDLMITGGPPNGRNTLRLRD